MSLEERLEKMTIVEKGGDEAYDAAMRLVTCFSSEAKLDSAAIYCRKIIAIGLQKKDPEKYTMGYRRLALVHLSDSRIDSTRYYLDLVLSETADTDDPGLLKNRATALMFYGALYSENNLGIEQAFLYFKSAIEISSKIEATHVFIRSSRALIENLMIRGKYDEALDYLNNALQYIEETEVEGEDDYHYDFEAIKAQYIIETATTEEEKNEALQILYKIYNLAEDRSHHFTKASTFIDIALNFADKIPEKELLELAESNFDEAKGKMGKSAEGGLLQAYGHVLIQTKQYHKAIPYLIEAKESLKTAPLMTNYMFTCEDLMIAYEQTGQIEKILPEFHDYRMFQDTLVAALYSDQLLELEEQYKTEKKERENMQLQAQNNIIQTRFRFSSIIGLLLLGLLAAGLYLFQKLKKNKQQLENLNQEKNKLFAILAHDLRNPIASLSNLSQKVKFLAENGRLNELDELAENTDSKLSALNDNLNNILLWAVTESNLVEAKPVKIALREELNKINELYADSISRKEIILTNRIPDTSYVHTDLTVLQTIMRNLVNNAVKFSEQGGVIEYDLKTTKEGMELRIIDKGIGLKPSAEVVESSDKALKRRNAKGSGIGLKISEELAAKSNLHLSVVPNPEGGTIGIIRFDKAA